MKFFAVFWLARTSHDLYGRVLTDTDLLGCVRIRSGTFGPQKNGFETNRSVKQVFCVFRQVLQQFENFGRYQQSRPIKMIWIDQLSPLYDPWRLKTPQ